MAIALISDCGATNLRTIAINEAGKIVASHHTPNHTQPDPPKTIFIIFGTLKNLPKTYFLCRKNNCESIKNKLI